MTTHQLNREALPGAILTGRAAEPRIKLLEHIYVDRGKAGPVGGSLISDPLTVLNFDSWSPVDDRRWGA
jgi:hypothetical protein